MSILEYETKQKAAALLKFDAAAGTGTALFSRYFTTDLDGDYTTDSFLPSGAVVPMLIAHQWSDIPVGKGKIRSTHEAGYVDFTLADTARGRELAEWLRFDMADNQPKSEWSYGFTVKEGAAHRETIDGRSVRVLSGLPDGAGCVVHECSYTLKGAGIGTQLISMKAEEQYHFRRMHEKILSQIAEVKAQEQREIRELFQRFMARERELQR